jgi:acetyl-CoA carboxylase biotin carboxyl carrier protein
VNLRKLKVLFDMVQGSSITVLEVRDASQWIRVRSSPGTKPPAAPRDATAAGVANPATAISAPHVDHVVKSSLVGTLHRAATPGAKPFVEVGDPVEAGGTLCVVEAMRIRNEIHADRAGIVAKVLVVSGQPVEYGQPLFVIA